VCWHVSHRRSCRHIHVVQATAPKALDARTPNRIGFGGRTDATVRMIPLLETGGNADRPF
jgi:hypothetical protein